MKSKTVLVTILFCLFWVGCSDDIVTPDKESSFDWREKGIISPAKDQGSYGTCWSFATAGLVEAVIKKDLNVDVDLSEQYLVNCSPEKGPIGAIHFVRENGILLEEKLPYSGSVDPDYEDNVVKDYKIAHSELIIVRDLSFEARIDSIQNLIENVGPVSTHMTYSPRHDAYQGGIYVHDGSSMGGGHIVLLVGWKDDANVKNGGYWIVKNSYGSSWGENGFFRIAYDELEIALYYVCVARGAVRL